ncbi:transposase [Halobacteriales archaeon SW_6_65_15]|nr:MAG: transposase [Halobacteriales archaeon SW_6_65_15]
MILDASYLFDLTSHDSNAFERRVEISECGEIQWVPTPVIAETYYGETTERSDTTEEEIRNRLLGYPRIDVNEEIARSAGQLLAKADDRAGGNAGVGLSDAYIAATAELLGQSVLTANVTDFEKLGVPVETY